MRNIIYIIGMLAVVSVWGQFVNDMQNQPAAKQLVAPAAASDAVETATMPLRLVRPPMTPKTISNARQAYKANCSGCHQSVRTFPAPMTATAMHHMRLQSHLRIDQTRDVLAYLTE